MSRTLLIPMCVFSLTITVFGASVGSAATMSSPLTISNQDYDEYFPDVAYNSVHDEYLVVWTEVSPTHSATIMGQRRTAAGAFIAEFVIAREDNPAHDNIAPSVAYDSGNDRYLVVWSHDYWGDSSDWDVHGRFVLWNGPSAGLPAFPINALPGKAWRPRVAFGAGTPQGFMVTWWNEWSGGSPPPNISAQRLDTAGTLQGGTISVASDATNWRIDADIAYNQARNEYLIVYQSMVGEVSDVDGVRLSATGAILAGGAFGIARWPDHEIVPRIAASRVSNRWAVVWQSQPLVVPREFNVFARLVWVDGTGTIQMEAPVAVSPLTVNEFYPDVAAHPESSNFLITWGQQYQNTSFDHGIWARVLHSTNRLGTFFKPITVLGGETATSQYPAIAAGKGDWMAAWVYTRDGTANYKDIYGRVLFGEVFSDGFEAGDMTRWSSSTQ